jgi:hypothetical protein
MCNFHPTRGLIAWATLACLIGGASVFACAQHTYAPARTAPVVRQAPSSASRGVGFQQAPAPIERRGPASGGSAARGAMVGPNPAASRSPKGHLGEWMTQHGGLTPAQQQQALEREPGFRQLPTEQQQHMRERLTQLNAMSPEQRQRMIARNEAMERLSPDQRTQVRGAMSQLGSLPPDQRQLVARSFREIRQLPPQERYAAMNSARYSYLNPVQRATLNNLIRVEPMLPPPEPPMPR